MRRLFVSLMVILSTDGVLWAAGSKKTESENKTVLQTSNTIALQDADVESKTGRYDWGVSVMKDGNLYRMWWVRLGGTNKKRFPYQTNLPDGAPFDFTYPDRGDRIYYAESCDGRTFNISGDDYAGSIDDFGPDATGPLMVLKPAESDQERNHVGCPTVVKVDGTFYMYYEAPCEFVCRKNEENKVQVLREYHNQVFLATSSDGKQWHKYPSNENPQPIIAAPEFNKKTETQRYGLGQPSVFYERNRFVMHYVDSCTGPGDFIVRLESKDPYFKNPRVFRGTLRPNNKTRPIPPGSVARFAQTDVKYLGRYFYLLRPAYGTGNVGLLISRTGRFDADANAVLPKNVFPQIALQDTRGNDYRERLFPDFLTTPTGEILEQEGHITVFYGSARGFKEHADTWNLFRADVSLADIRKTIRRR